MISLVGVDPLYSMALLYGFTPYVPHLHGFVTVLQYMQDIASYPYGKAPIYLRHRTLKVVESRTILYGKTVRNTPLTDYLDRVYP